MNTLLVFIITGLIVLNAFFIMKLSKELKTSKELRRSLSLVQSQFEKLKSQENMNALSNEVDYFKSQKDKIMFLLLEVDGKRRNQLLGITPDMYNDVNAAKKWYKSLSLQIHPDKNPEDENAAKAFNKLNELYTMITL